jgi:hypothetical protein
VILQAATVAKILSNYKNIVKIGQKCTSGRGKIRIERGNE